MLDEVLALIVSKIFKQLFKAVIHHMNFLIDHVYNYACLCAFQAKITAYFVTYLKKKLEAIQTMILS